MGGVFGRFAVLGFLLLASSGLIVVADIGGMSRRMPTQVPPRRIALYPFIAGVTLLVIAIVGSATA